MTRNKDLVALCAEQNLRLTRPRRVILDVLQAADDHPNVIELHRRASEQNPGIAIATVYRTVKLLEDRGIIDRHNFADGHARYEPAEGEHHDHLIDVQTGDVIEFRSDEIERLQEEIARTYGYEIVSHRLELYARPLAAMRRGKKTEF